MKHSLPLIGSAMLLLGAQAASATTIAYEDFSYNSGESLDGKNGGTDWTGAWTTSAGTSYTASTPLTYSAGTVNVTGDTSVALINANSTSLYSRQFAPQTGTLYFSFLFRFDDNGSEASLDTNDFVHFMLNNDTNNAKSGGIGLLSTSTNFLGARIGDGNGGTTTSSSTTMEPDTTYFLVGKLSKEEGSTNYNRIDLFVNPTSHSEPVPSVSDDLVSMGASTVSYLTIRGHDLESNDRYIIDELRISTTFASVVPEPSTAMLLLLGGTTMTLRRRASGQGR